MILQDTSMIVILLLKLKCKECVMISELYYNLLSLSSLSLNNYNSNDGVI